MNKQTGDVIEEIEAADVDAPEAEETAEAPEQSFDLAEADEPEVAASEDETTEEGEAPEADGKYRIGGKTFKTQREAFAYAEEIEREKAQVDAYNQGLREAIQAKSPVESVTPPVAPEEDFDAEFYKDPKAYLRKLKDEAKNEAKAELKGEISGEERVKQIWAEFYSENPDLQKKAKLVNVVLQENWDTLGHMKNYKEAMTILARKTRDEIRSWSDDDKPKKTLAPAGVRTASPGGQQSVTRKKTEERPVDFTTQLRNLRGKRSSLAAR